MAENNILQNAAPEIRTMAVLNGKALSAKTLTEITHAS